ncbi:collagen alpha-1(III) chain-like, partial [Amphibalanus amphitrite]|uniref:collagen alpha-1(III) chain-like n=1 Tax=Amphibalanus amphitrite TaxID=1232801 RepID=UPI001C924C4C
MRWSLALLATLVASSLAQEVADARSPLERQQLQATQNSPRFQQRPPAQFAEGRLGRLSGADQFRGQQDAPRDQFVDPRDQFRGPPPGRRQFDGPRDQFSDPRDQFDGPREQFGGPRDQFSDPRDQFGDPRDQFGGQQKAPVQQQQQRAPQPAPARPDRSKSRFKSIAYDESDGEGSFDYNDEEGQQDASPDRLSELLAISKFKCDPSATGYYADDTVDCAVFHYCAAGVKHSWVCPDGQSFHQINLICQPTGEGNICKRSNEFHFVNDFLYKQVNNDSSNPEYAKRFSLDPLSPSGFDADPNSIDQFGAGPRQGRPQAGLQQSGSERQRQRAPQRGRQRVRRPQPDQGVVRQQASVPDFDEPSASRPGIPKQQITSPDFQQRKQGRPNFGGPSGPSFGGPAPPSGPSFGGPAPPSGPGFGGPAPTGFGGPRGIPQGFPEAQGIPPEFDGPRGGKQGINSGPTGGLDSRGPQRGGPNQFRGPPPAGFGPPQIQRPPAPGPSQLGGPQGFGAPVGLQNLDQLRDGRHSFAQQREGQLGGGGPGQDQQLLDRPRSKASTKSGDSRQENGDVDAQFQRAQQQPGGRPDVQNKFRPGNRGPGGFQPGFRGLRGPGGRGPNGPGPQGIPPLGFGPGRPQNAFGPSGPSGPGGPRGGTFGGPNGFVGPQGGPSGGFIDPERLTQQGPLPRGAPLGFGGPGVPPGVGLPPGAFLGPQGGSPADIGFAGIPSSGFGGPGARQLRGIAQSSAPARFRGRGGGSAQLQGRPPRSSSASARSERGETAARGVQYIDASQLRRGRARRPEPSGVRPQRFQSPQGPPNEAAATSDRTQPGNPFPVNDIKPQLRFTGEPPQF